MLIVSKKWFGFPCAAPLESFSRAITWLVLTLRPGTPQSLARATWRPNNTKESWLSMTFLHCHLTSAPLNVCRGSCGARKPNNLWHHKMICRTLSNHAGITWVIRFYTNLWCPCHHKCMLSLRLKRDIPKNYFQNILKDIFWNVWTVLKDSTFHSNC